MSKVTFSQIINNWKDEKYFTFEEKDIARKTTLSNGDTIVYFSNRNYSFFSGPKIEDVIPFELMSDPFTFQCAATTPIKSYHSTSVMDLKQFLDDFDELCFRVFSEKVRPYGSALRTSDPRYMVNLS